MAVPLNTPLFVSTFAGPDVAAAASPGAIGGGWGDAGGVWSRASNAVRANPFPWYAKGLLRPPDEAARDVLLRAQYTDRGNFPMVQARYQANGDHYGVYHDGASLRIYKYVGGVETELGTVGTLGTPPATGTFSLWLRVRTMRDGARTYLAATVVNDATGQVVAINRQTDGDAALAGAGRSGIASIQNEPFTAFSAYAINPLAAWVVAIGDSIFAGAGYGTPLDRLGLDLNCDVLPLAFGGTTSADWAASIGTYLAQVAAFGATVCVTLLGANDCQAAHAITRAAYKANFVTLIAAVGGAGVTRFVLNAPLYTNRDAGLPGASLCLQYVAAIAELVNGIDVRAGDSAGYAYFRDHADELADESGNLIHPNTVGVGSYEALLVVGDASMYDADRPAASLTANDLTAVAAAVQSGLTAQGVTGPRAAALDNLNAPVASRATPADVAAHGARGPGAATCTQTVTAAGQPVPDADVWVTTDPAGARVVAGTLQTDSLGKATFLLDAGTTYYLWMQRDGVNPIVGQSFTAEAD